MLAHVFTEVNNVTAGVKDIICSLFSHFLLHGSDECYHIARELEVIWKTQGGNLIKVQQMWTEMRGWLSRCFKGWCTTKLFRHWQLTHTLLMLSLPTPVPWRNRKLQSHKDINKKVFLACFHFLRFKMETIICQSHHYARNISHPPHLPLVTRLGMTSLLHLLSLSPCNLIEKWRHLFYHQVTVDLWRSHWAFQS